MNLLNTKFRRASAAFAGTIIGLTGVAVFAAPASAHAPSVGHETACIKKDATTWDVTWTIGNDYGKQGVTAVVDSVKLYKAGDHDLTKPLDVKVASLEGAAAGTDVPQYSATGQPNADKAIKATSKVSTKLDKVKIAVVLKWSDGFTNDGLEGRPGPQTDTVSKPETCTEPTTPPTTAPTTTPPTTEPTTTPPSTPPATPELPVPTPSTTAEPGEFKPIVKMDCDTITIGMDNPKDGLEWTMGFETSKGEKRQITVAPGEKKTEMFSAKEGFKVKVTLTVTYEGEKYSDFTDIDYVKPADCDSSGNAGGLPVTGAAAGGIAGGAAVLLAIGVVLFVMARRRKVKFTA